jgi:hypothetical protein
MLLDGMVSQGRDYNSKVADLASINETPGEMPGKLKLIIHFLCNSYPCIHSSERIKEDRPEWSNGCQWQHPAPQDRQASAPRLHHLQSLIRATGAPQAP